MDVLLISMPFGPLYSPSLGLSLLKKSLEKDGHAVEIRYFLIKFAKMVGTKFYTDIANGFPLNHDLTGEWLFSSSFFKNDTKDIRRYIHQIIMGNNPHHSKEKHSCKAPERKFVKKLIKVQGQCNDFIEDCLDEVISRKPQIVGFTSVFQQQLASLFLAKRIKETDPFIKIVFGGANNEGAMGLEHARQFPFIDAVVSGEGEMVFNLLVSKLENHEDFGDIKGVICKGNLHRYSRSTLRFSAEPVKSMDILPFPDYDDYFTQLKSSEIRIPGKPRILFESSRGCWWGEKNHCTFCGLNGENMRHRSKSAVRVLSELDYLTERYEGYPISVVDNILDMSYFKTLLPELAKRGDDKVELFYEIKSNLRQDQVLLLKNAGITMVQPGIESLSDPILKLMRKGVKAIQNIQLLKWCKEYGISAEWNILWGFPGEDPLEYAKMAALVPLISHLKPPHGYAPIRLDRFSPNFDTPDMLGFKDLAPFPAYEYLYPFDTQALHNVSYFFTYEYKRPQNVEEYVSALAAEIQCWKSHHAEYDLFYADKGDYLLIWDFRPIATRHLTTLRGIERLVYLHCDKIRTADQLVEYCREYYSELTINKIKQVLDRLIAENLSLSDNVHFLSLALQLNKFYSPTGNVLAKLNNYIRKVGKRDGTGSTVIRQFEDPFLVSEETPLCSIY